MREYLSCGSYFPFTNIKAKIKSHIAQVIIIIDNHIAQVIPIIEENHICRYDIKSSSRSIFVYVDKSLRICYLRARRDAYILMFLSRTILFLF